MEGHGAAQIESPDRVVTGDVLVYEVDSGILVVTGEGLRMETPDEVVTARDSLEYWSKQRMAVARGDAYAERANGDIVQADVLTGYFSAPDEQGEAAEGNESAGNEAESGAAEGGNTGPMGDAGGMERMEAFGNVVITTPQEVVRGDRAVYDVTEEIATVVDNVTISTATDQLAGERAVMNLKTGVSRLLGTGGSDGRARALIVPQGPRTEPVTPDETGTDMAPATQ
jgi:lipopolysaccharide export system protein LptA